MHYSDFFSFFIILCIIFRLFFSECDVGRYKFTSTLFTGIDYNSNFFFSFDFNICINNIVDLDIIETNNRNSAFLTLRHFFDFILEPFKTFNSPFIDFNIIMEESQKRITCDLSICNHTSGNSADFGNFKDSFTSAVPRCSSLIVGLSNPSRDFFTSSMAS